MTFTDEKFNNLTFDLLVNILSEITVLRNLLISEHIQDDEFVKLYKEKLSEERKRIAASVISHYGHEFNVDEFISQL
jgi:hypothetical protein